MLELLQIAPSNGMDIMFNLGDLITLGVIIVPSIIGYTRLQGKTKNRIDKTQERMEKLNDANQIEFKSINEKLNRILGLLEK